MKIIGKGGTVNYGGSVANVTSFDFSENDGGVYGQNSCSGKVSVILDDTATPLRTGTRATLTLSVSSDAGWTITVTNADLKSGAITVRRDGAVTQELIFESKQTATIA